MNRATGIEKPDKHSPTDTARHSTNQKALPDGRALHFVWFGWGRRSHYPGPGVG